MKEDWGYWSNLCCHYWQEASCDSEEPCFGIWGISWSYSFFPPQWSGPVQEACKMGPHAEEWRQKKESVQISKDFFCCLQPLVQGNAGQHCHYGRDNGVLSQSQDEKAIQTVDKNGQIRLKQGQADGQGFLQCWWPHLHTFYLEGASISSANVVKVMGLFLKNFKMKRPILAEQERFF